jgi:hypothetical protein
MKAPSKTGAVTLVGRLSLHMSMHNGIVANLLGRIRGLLSAFNLVPSRDARRS